MTSPPKGVPEEQLDDLYHGPLEEFTPARNELAKSLRSDGDAEAADWVKGLRKPTRAAWLVNQLAVRKPKEVRRLLDVGEELRAAQEEMLAGSADREKLREAGARERKTIDSLVRTAEAIGREHGVGAQILDRVGETLQAAASDPEVAEAIEKGRLTREQRACGDRAGRRRPRRRRRPEAARRASARPPSAAPASSRRSAARRPSASSPRPRSGSSASRRSSRRAREAVEEAEQARPRRRARRPRRPPRPGRDLALVSARWRPSRPRRAPRTPARSPAPSTAAGWSPGR